MYVRGALDSAHFHRMRKVTIYQACKIRANLTSWREV
jgi:hypothetical protein